MNLAMSKSDSTYSRHAICALIPTFNNAGTIVDVVTRVHQQLRDIIVVVDGSTDNISLKTYLFFCVLMMCTRMPFS